MPSFSNRLPDKAKHMGFDIVRTPTSGNLVACITSEDLLVVDTHYWNGRTIPCERKTLDAAGEATAGTCEACNAATPFRTHVYVAAFRDKTHDHFIFECTAHAAKAFAEYREKAGTLRGCAFTASRPKQTKNGKVVVETRTANLCHMTLPQPPNLARALCTIWRVPTPDHASMAQGYSSATSEADTLLRGPGVLLQADQLRQQREQLDNAGGTLDTESARRRFLADLVAAGGGNGESKTGATAK